MTEANIKRLYEHFCRLAKGDFTERNFDQTYGDEGRMSMGKMSPARVELIKSDAKRHKEQLEKKFPYLVEGDKKILEKI